MARTPAVHFLPHAGRFCRVRATERATARRFSRPGGDVFSIAVCGYDWSDVCGSNFKATPFMQ